MVENGWYESVSLSDYVGVVWRRKWIALLVTVMVTAAAIGFSERQQKLFAATSQLVNTSPRDGHGEHEDLERERLVDDDTRRCSTR